MSKFRSKHVVVLFVAVAVLIGVLIVAAKLTQNEARQSDEYYLPHEDFR